MVALVRSKLLAIAVDIGGTNLRVAIVSNEGRIIRRSITKTIKKGKSGEAVAEQVIGEIIKIGGIGEGRNWKKYKGIGVSIAGPINYQKGGSVNPPNMNFKFVPVVSPLEREFGLPVFMVNDCNAGVVGEKCFGAGKKSENLVYITVSSGVGGGAIVNGNLLLGKDGNAVEIGHMIVDTEYSLLCSCKKGRGHWEAYTSGNNIPKFFQAWARKKNLDFRSPNSTKEIFEAAKRKEKIALEFVKELGRINGRGISNVIAAYDPELIVLGGAVALNNFSWLMRYAIPNLDKFLKKPKIVKSSLGESAPLMGAAAIVFGRLTRK